MSTPNIGEVLAAALMTGMSTGITDTAKKAIADCVDEFKTLITKKLGSHSAAVKAFDEVEISPLSEGRKLTFTEELNATQALSDPEIRSVLQVLVANLNALQSGTSRQFAKGNFIGQASGPGSKVTLIIDGSIPELK